jgi:hypothetical protein
MTHDTEAGRLVATWRSVSGIQISASITVLGARKRPTIVQSRPSNERVLPIANRSDGSPSRVVTSPPTMISSRPATGNRPSAISTSGCTRSATSRTPRTTAFRSLVLVADSRTDRAEWISGDAYATPACDLRPRMLATAIPSVAASICERSTLSSLPAPRIMMFWCRPPSCVRVSCMPRTNPPDARINSTTSAEPMSDAARRTRLRPRLRKA